jgi:hypothetical protein
MTNSFDGTTLPWAGSPNGTTGLLAHSPGTALMLTQAELARVRACRRPSSGVRAVGAQQQPTSTRREERPRVRLQLDGGQRVVKHLHNTVDLGTAYDQRRPHADDRLESRNGRPVLAYENAPLLRLARHLICDGR